MARTRVCLGAQGRIRSRAAGRGREADDDFRTWVEPHLTVLRRVALRLVDPAHVDDVLQETVLRAWRHHGTYEDERGSVRTWLLGILANECRRAYGRTRRTVTVLHDDPPSAPDVGDPRTDVRLDVEAALRTLPSRQREVIALYYLADLPVAEVATILGITAGSVKTHLSAARHSLAPLLEVL